MNRDELRYTNFAQIHVAAHEEFWKSFGRGFSTASLGGTMTITKHLLILLWLIILAGCTTHVKIDDVQIESIREDEVLITLYTNRDLAKYENSIWAINVYLSYTASSLEVSTKFEDAGDTWEYPFTVFEKQYIKCASFEHKFCSTWKIPLGDKSSLALFNYEYVLNKGDTITFKVGGGNMGCCFLTSQAFEVTF